MLDYDSANSNLAALMEARKTAPALDRNTLTSIASKPLPYQPLLSPPPLLPQCIRLSSALTPSFSLTGPRSGCVQDQRGGVQVPGRRCRAYPSCQGPGLCSAAKGRLALHSPTPSPLSVVPTAPLTAIILPPTLLADPLLHSLPSSVARSARQYVAALSQHIHLHAISPEPLPVFPFPVLVYLCRQYVPSTPVPSATPPSPLP